MRTMVKRNSSHVWANLFHTHEKNAKKFKIIKTKRPQNTTVKMTATVCLLP